MTTHPQHSTADTMAAAWTRLWFEPAPARPLAIVRILTGVVALALWWSWSADLLTWFGPEGLMPIGAVRAWRSPWAVSALDALTAPATVRGFHLALGLVLVSLTVGFATPLVAPLAAVGFAGLLNRAPMLAGPADDCIAVLLWCLVVGRSGDDLSVDRWLPARAGRPAPPPHLRNQIALSLLLLHGIVITLAALLAQSKGDAWWDGSAAWWLAGREDAALQLQSLYRRSEYLMNGIAHAITLFEALFVTGLCIPGLRRSAGWLGVCAWPVVGLLAGEPWWGAAMGVLAVAAAVAPPDRNRQPG
jgi:hypothetical protein